MNRVELFLSCVLYDKEFNIPAKESDIAKYIELDWWIEFPTRSLAKILERYEVLIRKEEK